MTRRTIALLIAFALGLIVAPFAADAPPPKKAPTIGMLEPGFPPSAPDWKQRSVFLQELRTLGWKEGENVTVESHWPSGRFDRGADLAAELVRLNVNVIVVGGPSPLIRAVQQATTIIPIVMMSGDDAVAARFIAGLPRPGGNITGVDSSFVPAFSGKLLELLKEAVPAATRIAVLVTPPYSGDVKFTFMMAKDRLSIDGEREAAGGISTVTMKKVAFQADEVLQAAPAATIPRLPEMHMTPPAADLPPAVAAFSGMWEGVWDGVLPSRLLVEAIDTASARLVYAWANHPQGLFKGGWVRVQAKVLPGGMLQWSSNSGRGQMVEEATHAAQAVGVQLHILEARHPHEIERAFDTATRQGDRALLILPSMFFSLHQNWLVALAAKHRLPAMYWRRSFAEAGGLLAYGQKLSDLARREAYYVDRLLRGAKPADLPVERVMSF
jgi:ABC-type uncharacterized transport system substrate-binding protein